MGDRSDVNAGPLIVLPDDDDEELEDSEDTTADEEAVAGDDDDEPAADIAESDGEAEGPSTTTSTTTIASTTTTARSDSSQCAAQFPGQESPSEVTGVENFLNGRSGPSLGNSVVVEIPRGQMVTAFVDHVEFQDRRWVPVLTQTQQVCAWVDMSFLQSGGRLLTNPTATGYVIRALGGLNAEAAHANRVQLDPNGPLSPITADEISALNDAVARLKTLGDQLGDTAVVTPDEANTFNDSEPGCAFNDLRVCSVLVSNGNQTLARVTVVWAGNGVSDTFIEFV